MRKSEQEFINKKFDNCIITEYIEYKDNNHFVKIVCNCGEVISNRKRYSDINNKTRCINCRFKYSIDNDKKRLNVIYKGMKTRCYNSNFPQYKNYGQKGIKICDEWLNNKYEFIKWSLKNGYKKGLTIDRINPNLDYCPTNCRWISKSLNSAYANQQRIRKLTKPIMAISPQGEHILIENNIKEFYDKYNLDDSSIRKVCKGIYKSHKGWKFYYVE